MFVGSEVPINYGGPNPDEKLNRTLVCNLSFCFSYDLDDPNEDYKKLYCTVFIANLALFSRIKEMEDRLSTFRNKMDAVSQKVNTEGQAEKTI
jgi:hypothetical protein